MKLILKNEDLEVEVKEIRSIPNDCETLIITINDMLRKNDIEEFEQYLSNKIGKKVMLLDSRYKEAVGV